MLSCVDAEGIEQTSQLLDRVQRRPEAAFDALFLGREQVAYREPVTDQALEGQVTLCALDLYGQDSRAVGTRETGNVLAVTRPHVARQHPHTSNNGAGWERMMVRLCK